jgi:hypothetical protein
MNYVKASQNWEEVFIQEAIDLEEKMTTLDAADLNKPRLRLALENEILSWKKYQLWISSELACASLKDDIDPAQLADMATKARETLATVSHHEFWNENLMPIDTWDGNLLVIGLEKSEQLIEVPNCIFLLAPLSVLSVFASKLFSEEGVGETSLVSTSLDESDSVSSLPDGIDINAAAPKLSFDTTALRKGFQKTTDEKPKEITASSATPPAPVVETNLWDYISERHDEYSFEARKQFDAYMVLKIENKHTHVFKMDPDFQKREANLRLFDYDLETDNPFKKVLESGNSESFNINQLGFELFDFKYACITPLKRGPNTIGFLLGLKTGRLAENDQILLEDLAKESA